MAGKQVQIYSPLNNLVHPETEASVVKVVDADNYYTGEQVEVILQEIGVALNGKALSSHNHTLDGLSNTAITSNTAGEILKWNGAAWINNTLAEAGIQGTLAAGYGDTTNPYASKTAKYFLAAPNAAEGVPSFRAIVASDIPTLNQSTTGSAATLTTPRTLTIGSTGKNFDGSANVSWTLAEIGAQAAGSYAAAVHTHGTYDNSTALTGANVYSNIAVTDGIITGLTSRALTASDIGAAKKATNEATATDGQVLTANGDGTFTFEATSSVSSMSVFTEEFTATEGQTNFTLTTGSYSPGNNRLVIYIWGLRQHATAFTETSGTTFALAAGVPAGTKVLAEWRVADATLKGDKGDAATVAVGTTTTGAAGTSASVTNSGTSSAAVFNFTVPRGDTGATGAAATITAGTVTTLAAGSNPTVTNSGTSSAAVFNFGIPAPTLTAGYGDTTNPYASKTAKFFLAAPNASEGVPTFRAIVASDIPTLNQSTTGSAATLTTARTLTIGSTGKTFNGSANVSWTLAEIGAAKQPTNEATATAGQILTSNGGGTATYVDFSGGGQLLGTAAVKAISYNSQNISENITIPGTVNAMSVGPIVISEGFTVVVEDGATWVII